MGLEIVGLDLANLKIADLGLKIANLGLVNLKIAKLVTIG